MVKYPKIWFLRHGQTQWNLERRIQGRMNSNLTELGLEQAGMQSRLMAPILDDILAQGGHLFCSPQGRARQTAQIALGGRTPTFDDRLCEVATGDWEGRLRSEVTPGDEGLEAYVAAPGGEGFHALSARVTSFLDHLDAPAVVVSHGILGQVLRGIIRGLERSEMAGLSNLQGCAYVLEDGREIVMQEA